MDILNLIDKDIWGVDPFFHTANKIFNKPGGHDIKIDLIEHVDHFTIKANLPGVTVDCIRVNFDLVRHTLNISVVENMEKSEVASGDVHFRERSSFLTSRIIPFKQGSVDVTDIGAKYEDGVLELNVKKINEGINDKNQFVEVKVT